jgi:hypothetical protein
MNFNVGVGPSQASHPGTPVDARTVTAVTPHNTACTGVLKVLLDYRVQR